jgi:predicted O-methyltransferase YrrM
MEVAVNYATLENCLELMRTLMEYRHQPIHPQLQNVHKRHSMLHVDVLALIYHFAKTSGGDVLEIGAYLGGSTIAAAFGVRDSGTPKKIVSIELGGRCTIHPRLPSKNILKDLKKNLAKRTVADLITLLEGRSEYPAVVSAVHQHLRPGGTTLLIIDADGKVQRDIELYQDLLAEGCWMVIDDYFMPGPGSKAVFTQPQVDAYVSAGRLETLGFYGWGTWIGRWHATPLMTVTK